MPLMFKPSKRPGRIVASESVLESFVNRYRQPLAFKKLVVGSLNILRESVPVNALVLTDRVCIVAETLRVRQERSSAAILSKSGSDPGPINRVKGFLRGSRTGCQYR